ncbi:MAG: hypothetical protein HW414_1470 [Dehalococcoidia bacterium]|nr:hypothetical protein [Dehalococcoidia bacterium]
MLKLSRVALHQWHFVYPDAYSHLMDLFDEGCESYDEGDLDQAERAFNAVLAAMPDHLDAIHHLAMVLSERDLIYQANDLWEQAVRIGRKTFPKDFNPGEDRLQWGWLENRPFLRCLHGLALAKYEEYHTGEALSLFQELLSLNPNDNQGVRAMAEEALFELNRFEDALKVTEQYPDDMMPETLYGQALALYILGRIREADGALREAIEYSPLVRKELLKKRHRLPRSARPDAVAVGSTDEAYCYWEHFGRFWEAAPGSLDWLREMSAQKREARPDIN